MPLESTSETVFDDPPAGDPPPEPEPGGAAGPEPEPEPEPGEVDRLRAEVDRLRGELASVASERASEKRAALIEAVLASEGYSPDAGPVLEVLLPPGGELVETSYRVGNRLFRGYGARDTGPDGAPRVRPLRELDLNQA
jgi:hypothetical protein